jgi:hypothetical protein
MLARLVPLALFVLSLGLPASPALGQGVASQDIWQGTVQFGDSLHWAGPTYDDSDWPRALLYPAPDTLGTHWIRARITLDSTRTPFRMYGLKLSILAAAEVYWDGVLIGRNGRVGPTRAEEQPGALRAVFPVPDSLYTPGEHLIAVRLSNFYMPLDFAYYLYAFEVGPYASLLTDWTDWALLPFLFLGGFLIIMVYCAVLYALDRRRTALGLFSLLCLCVAALLAAEVSRFVINYAYDWHPIRIHVLTTLTGAVAVLLPLFFMVRFDAPHKRPLMAGLAGLLTLSLLLPASTDEQHYWMFWSALITALGVVGWAVIQRRRGAVLALLGVGASIGGLAASGWWFIDTYFFPTFAVIVMALLASLGLQMREQRRQRKDAQLAAARLEIELLKKHLQPHFLMNTLTAAMEWMEEQPDVGVRFIEALADELRLLVDVSDQTHIPLATEIDLCRRHLEVMGYRQDRTFQLHVEGVDPEAPVPPAVFHTLLENALTHNRYAAPTVCFRLEGERLGDGWRYTLHAPLNGRAPAIGREGTGLRYVKARLRESVGDAWSLTSTPRNGTWATTIELRTGG